MRLRGVDCKFMNGIMFWTHIYTAVECDTFVELRGHGRKIVFKFDWMTMRDETLQLRK